MKELFIKAKLNAAPAHRHVQPLFVITKGSTAEILYN
jgi:hypothetical protein